MSGLNVCVALRSLNKAITRFIDTHGPKREIDRITGQNGWIIGYIASNSDRDVYQRDLENEFGITRSTASKNIDLMVQKGLIERQSVENDGRLKKLVLTDKALEIAKKIKGGHEYLEERLTRGFSEKELEQLNAFLLRMQNNLSEN